MKSKSSTAAKIAPKSKTKSEGKSRTQTVASFSGKKTSAQKNAKASSKNKDKVAAKATASDIIQIILQDHKPHKELIETLKDDETEFADKKPVFEEFAPLLLSHAEPEEQSLYMRMKEDKELRSEGFEGQTEHAIASQLIEEINQTSEEDEWMAKVKVLAEMVEHHISEEEETMFPDLIKQFDTEERIAIGEDYVRLRDDYRMENAIPVYPSKKSDQVHAH